MEPRLDAEIETINDALDEKVDLTDPRLTDERTPLDNSVTSAKIANGAIVDEDINDDADIAPSKILGTAVTQADTGTVTGTMIADGTITGTDIDDATIESVNLAEQEYIKFDTTYTGGSTQPGELAWDADNETLQFQLDAHVTLQIGQEHVMRIKNNSGSVAIPERTVVMFAGATGDTIKVSPAVSDGSINVNYLAGITTEEIPADGFGFITQLGFINQVNTNAWPVGTILYVDPATPGGLTATEPESPAWTMPVAAVTKQNSSSGRLLVRAIPGGSGAGGGASVNVSDTAPAGGNEGDLWLDSTDGTLYVYYEDIDGAQWVQVQANSALGASIESRLGALESQAIAYGNPNPNVVINGAFNIWQRGTSFSTSGSYTADRWYNWTTSGTVSVSRQNFTGGELPVAGFGENQFFMRHSWTAGNGFSIAEQRVEDVRTLSGQTVTLSFWARSNVSITSTPEIEQNFGSGGSSATYLLTTNVNIGTSWARHSVTYNIPNVSGKTIGANNFLAIRPIRVNGTTSHQIDIWGVQLEVGSTSTGFRRNANSIAGELAACQRYYWRTFATDSYATFGMGIAHASNQASIMINNPVNMRVPATSIETSSLAIWDSVTVIGAPTITLRSGHQTTGATNVIASVAGNPLPQYRPWFLLNGNNPAAFFGVSAEL
jgi:hypothetical protein